MKAMEGVTPLPDRKTISSHAAPGRNTGNNRDQQEEDVQKTIQELVELIQGHRPFPVEDIPGYMEGPPINSDRQLLRRLRSGGFAVQAYCELHGLTGDEALKVCDGFMSDALMNNRRCIAFIHGRGKSSPERPVLKELVKDFLNRGRFRRYILAYSSAPTWDGGPGVTYVLLRKRPVRKTRAR
jgi:DNA-nicking Smr family endonuclease